MYSPRPFAMADVYVVQYQGCTEPWVRSYFFSSHSVLATLHWIAPIGSLRCSSVNDIPTHFVLGSRPLAEERIFDISATAE